MNDNNFMEAGWQTQAVYDQQAHPFKTEKDAGVVSSVVLSGINLPQNAFEAFRVVDANDDNVYQSYYGNNQIGVNNTVTINAGSSFAISESESTCSSDSLWAEFRELRYISNQGGSLVNYVDVLERVDLNSGPYQFCRRGSTSYDVKQTC